MSVNLQVNLTQSIRRAKEKIYNNPTQNYSLHNQLSRGRTHSQKDTPGINTHSNASAAAIKSLQERIAALQREKREWHSQSQQSLSQPEPICPQDRDKQMEEVCLTLTQKQNQLQKLHHKNTQLHQTILHLQQQLQKQQRQLQQFSTQLQQKPKNIKQYTGQQRSISMLLVKDRTINDLQEKNRQYCQRNQHSLQTIQKLMGELQGVRKELQREKKNNQQMQNKGMENNQNNSLEINQIVRESTSKQKINKEKIAYAQLFRNNKKLTLALQRNELKTSQLSRQLNQSSQLYNRLKLLVSEVIDTVKEITPHGNTHLRILLNRIQKLQNGHIQSLRSYSINSRRNIFRRSNSKQHKKSLKMSDLNSSAKKSQERSGTKSHSKGKHLQLLSHSQKKSRLVPQHQLETQLLEKDIKVLKRQSKNLLMKVQKDEDSAVKEQLDEVIRLIQGKTLELAVLRTRGKHTPTKSKSKADNVLSFK